jgi:glutamyl-tRNA synthetase
MSSPVVTRFAPSPTGFLHIGGARTALFNWLFAKHHGGKMLLRIEDTDRERSTDAAIEAIIDGLDWLGLKWDGDTIYQFARAGRHAEVALDLLGKGLAYKCYATAEELTEMRELARKESRPPRYDGRWRDLGGTQAEQDAIAEGRKAVIRLKAPKEGETVIDDKVQGRVVFANKDLDDLVLLRSDGTPTYMLAVVVDDHDMAVTHVIRGDDHLRNTFRQIPIYEAMGWEVPHFSHLPMIHGNDGAKLSKRHGALSTTAYRDFGYLPEGMKAYLLRLGWSHGDQEIFTEDEAISLFDLSGVNKAPARLDLEKLGTVNAHFIRLAKDERLFELLTPFLQADGALDADAAHRTRRALPHMKDRGSTLIELAEAFRFLRSHRPLELNKNAKKALSEDGIARLTGLLAELCKNETWTIASISETISAYCGATQLSMGQVGPPLRAALTGGLPAPDLAPVMEWLGRNEALGRIEDQIKAGARGGAASG